VIALRIIYFFLFVAERLWALAARLGSSAAIFTLGLLLLLREPSWQKCIACAGLLCLQLALVLVYQNISDILLSRQSRRHFLRIRTGYRFKRMQLDDPIVEAGHYQPAKLDRHKTVGWAVRSYHSQYAEPLLIYQGTPTDESKLFPACASYPGINISSIVLIFDDPQRNPVARFRFYHELAHVGWLAPSSASYRLAIDPFAIFVIFFFCASSTATCLSAAWSLMRIVTLKCGLAETEGELVADRVALHQIGKSPLADDAERVVRMLERNSQAADRLGRSAVLAFVRARAARAYLPKIKQAPSPAIRARRVEGPFGLAVLVFGVLVEAQWAQTGWVGAVAPWLCVLTAGCLWYLLFGFVLRSGDRLKYDKNIDSD